MPIAVATILILIKTLCVTHPFTAGAVGGYITAAGVDAGVSAVQKARNRTRWTNAILDAYRAQGVDNAALLIFERNLAESSLNQVYAHALSLGLVLD